jgi:hypothetical protein
MKPIHAIGIGFGALYAALLIRSALKNYLNVSL